MKVITIVGARPQFIKAAVVSRAFRNIAPTVKEIIIHTGQHYDNNMSKVFFDELNIPEPNYNLGIGGGTHGQNTGRMIEKIEEILLKETPDWLLVYGDTDSTLAGALAAAKLQIPIAHVEAGLRSFNRKMPEELNRILTDHLSSLLFTPTDRATRNLSNEGIHTSKIEQVGDVMFDAMKFYKNKTIKPKQFDNNKKEFILCTIHRAENTDDPLHLTSIISALNEIAKTIAVVLPLHPRTRQLLSSNNTKNTTTNNITFIDPVSYLEMIWLLENCSLVITDSGGLQKEASFAKKLCLTIREETEWVELVENQLNILVGTNEQKIIKTALDNISKNIQFPQHSLYGIGNTGSKIVSSLITSKQTNK